MTARVLRGSAAAGLATLALCATAAAGPTESSAYRAMPLDVTERCEGAPEGWTNFVRVPLEALLPLSLRQAPLDGPTMPALAPTRAGHCVVVWGLPAWLADSPARTPPAPKLPLNAELIWAQTNGKTHAMVAPRGSLEAWRTPPETMRAQQDDAALEREVLAAGETRLTPSAPGPGVCFARLRDRAGRTWALIERGRMHGRLESGRRQTLVSIGRSAEGWRFVGDAPGPAGLEAPSRLTLIWPDPPSGRSWRHGHPVTLRWEARRDAPWALGASRNETLELVFEDRCERGTDPVGRRSLGASLLYWLAH